MKAVSCDIAAIYHICDLEQQIVNTVETVIELLCECIKIVQCCSLKFVDR